MTTIPLSAHDYNALVRTEKSLEAIERNLERLIGERDEYKKAYENSVNNALKKSVEYENMRRREESLSIMLSQACDEMEGIFDSTGKLASPQIAVDYTVWARYLDVSYGRKNHRVYEVQEWMENLNHI